MIKIQINKENEVNEANEVNEGNEGKGFLSPKVKNILWIIFAVVMVVVFIILFINDDLEHIEDTNGADNYNLQTITDEDICKMEMGAINITEQEALIGETVTYKSKCFTGVYEVYRDNIITNRFEITVNHAKVSAGNFKMVLCVDDEIVHTFTLNEQTQTFVLEDVKGTVSLRIAGESANFQFDYYVY